MQCDPPLYYLPIYQSGFFFILILNLTPPLSSSLKLFSNNVRVTDSTLYCLLNQPPTMRMRGEFAVFGVLPVLRSEIRMVNLGEREEHADMIQPTNLLRNFPQTSLAIFFFPFFRSVCFTFNAIRHEKGIFKENSRNYLMVFPFFFFLFIYLHPLKSVTLYAIGHVVP